MPVQSLLDAMGKTSDRNPQIGIRIPRQEYKEQDYEQKCGYCFQQYSAQGVQRGFHD